MKSCILNNEVSFHDSTLLSVKLRDQDLILTIDFVTAPSIVIGELSDTEYFTLQQVEIICSDAKTKMPEFWVNTTKAEVHPNPENPMREIMKNSLECRELHISGWAHENGWVEWIIEASSYVITWKEETSHPKISMQNK